MVLEKDWLYFSASAKPTNSQTLCKWARKALTLPIPPTQAQPAAHAYG